MKVQAPHNRTPMSHMLWQQGLEEIPSTVWNERLVLERGFVLTMEDELEVPDVEEI